MVKFESRILKVVIDNLFRLWVCASESCPFGPIGSGTVFAKKVGMIGEGKFGVGVDDEFPLGSTDCTGGIDVHPLVSCVCGEDAIPVLE